MGEVSKGVAAPIILEQLGIDPAWLGESRVADIRQHIKKRARQIEGFKGVFWREESGDRQDIKKIV